MSNKPVESPKKKIESVLLVELAGEATSKLQAIQSETEEQHVRSRHLNAALKRIYQFMQTFSVHVNNIAPTIQRVYHVDSNTTYSELAWLNALADFRKQSLSEKALVDHVAFSVRLQASEPVVVTRRWNQMDALKKELDVFGLRPLDDLDTLVRNKSKQETFSARLSPDFFMRIMFKGDYTEGLVEINGKNLDDFGMSNFRLNPEDATNEMLDDLGRFLIGRTDELPAALRLARFMPKVHRSC